MTEVQDFLQGARTLWSAGRWDDVSNLIAGVGQTLLDHVGIERGMDVLDVGTGTGGTVAIPAARRGARVVGSDLVPEHFDDARRRAAEAGVEVEWVEANAEELPFDDESFDRVLSTFGHMFAPRHELAGAELARVCRSGGVVGTCTWLPDSVVAQTLKIVGSRMPPPPDFAQPPPLWGDEQHVREMLEPHGLELEFHRETNVFELEGDVAHYLDWHEARLGPMLMAKQALGDGWADVRAEIAALYEERDEGGDGGVRLPSEYLVTIGRKR